jgi:pimeloyl-ACP methyl ester carboxylesterase
MNVQEHRTSRDGLRFRHRIVEHPCPAFAPTLFVSGAFQTMDSWARFATSFAPHTTVLLVDPPGMGESDLLPPGAGVDFLAACLEQVLDERGIAKATVISASYGTPAAFTLAGNRPDRVDRIVLAGTMKELPSHLRTRIDASIGMACRFDRDALATECIDGMLCHDPLVSIDRRESAARVLRSSVTRMSDAELSKYAANTERLLNHEPLATSPRIVGPEALVFTGEHDVFSSPAACREVATAFDRAWFTTIRRADHLFHLQRGDSVRELILKFAARTLGSAPTEGWHAIETVNEPLEEPAAVDDAYDTSQAEQVVDTRQIPTLHPAA